MCILLLLLLTAPNLICNSNHHEAPLHFSINIQFRVVQEIWVKKHGVTSDFRQEVEIQPFRACAFKNMQYNPYHIL